MICREDILRRSEKCIVKKKLKWILTLTLSDISKMPTSYQQRLIENNELRLKNRELSMKITELMRAVDILNKCIHEISHINKTNYTDLEEQFKELCKDMGEDKSNS